LKPWQNDPETRELVDPDSIDIGFHFPGRANHFEVTGILRLKSDFTKTLLINDSGLALGLKQLGFDHRRQTVATLYCGGLAM